jgi:lysophospholipase L1-like esterase
MLKGCRMKKSIHASRFLTLLLAIMPVPLWAVQPPPEPENIASSLDTAHNLDQGGVIRKKLTLAQREQKEFDRFAPEISEFQSQDKGRDIINGGLLFIGSSSIRHWDVEAAFPGLLVVNHGFGGSAIPDVIHYYREVVSIYRPEVVIVYAGENDIARGESPDQVIKDITTLLERLHVDLPHAHIVYLSLKTGGARLYLWPKMQTINAAIREKAERERAFDFLDVANPLFGPDGLPDNRYFFGDHIHLSPKGYDVWNTIVNAYLKDLPIVKHGDKDGSDLERLPRERELSTSPHLFESGRLTPH